MYKRKKTWLLIAATLFFGFTGGAISTHVPVLASQTSSTQSEWKIIRAPVLASQTGSAQSGWEIIRARANPHYNDQQAHIPAVFGRLASVDSDWQSSGAGQSWLWFEGSDGTIRIVSVKTDGNQANYVWNVVKEFPRR